jgi:heterodisulfide reductase subunit A
VQHAAGQPDVVHAASLGYGCFGASRAQIREAIERHGLNRVVVVGCSHRTHESLFQRTVRQAGLNPYLMEMVNVREHCAWVHSAQPQAATRKAIRLLDAGLARARTVVPLYKQTLDPVRRALVLGGGVAGMTAALSIADSGYDVTLVELSNELGGNLRHVYYVAEAQSPQRLLRDLVNRVRGHERITVLTRSRLIQHAGSVGRFRSVIHTEPADGGELIHSSVEHGVTVVATGGEEWRGDVYLFGRDRRVITGIDLEDRIAHQPETIAELNHVVMIQCVRSPEAVDYCSRICCTNSIKNAIRIKLLNPNCRVTILYRDIITYGFREQYYTEARRRGVVFVRYSEGDEPQVESASSPNGGAAERGRLGVTIEEPVLGRRLAFEPDLLVLNMAITPSAGTAELAGILGVPVSSEGFFMEAHLKMRPMDFMAEGIFLAGMAHYPKFIEETIAHAQATAGRAISVLSKQPLFIGGSVATVDQSRCVACLTCVRTCPFGIPHVQPGQAGVGKIMGVAYIDPALCQGCGTCTGECPAKAIQLLNYTDAQVLAQVAV